MYVPGKVVLPDIMIYVRKRKVPRWRKRVQKRMSGFFLFAACCAGQHTPIRIMSQAQAQSDYEDDAEEDAACESDDNDEEKDWSDMIAKADHSSRPLCR